MADELRKSEFADMLGVSRAYISQLSKAGRLILSADGQRVQVKPTLDRLAATSSIDKCGVAARHALDRAAKGGHAAPVPAVVRDASAGISVPKPLPPVPGDSPHMDSLTSLLFSDPMAAYNAARAGNEIKRGEQMDIELAKTRRELIGLDGVVKVVTDLAMSTRASLDRVPDRIATVLAAETDPAKVYEILQAEITALCEQIMAASLGIADKLE